MHEPSAWTRPAALQRSALLNSQLGPAYPSLQSHPPFMGLPLAPQLPGLPVVLPPVVLGRGLVDKAKLRVEPVNGTVVGTSWQVMSTV